MKLSNLGTGMTLFGRTRNTEHVDVQHTLLDRRECTDFLRTRAIATVAFTLRNRATVEPVYYVLDPDFPDWMYLRGMPGSILSGAISNPWVAVNVRDEITATEWTNVVVYGRMYVLTTRGADASPKPHARGVDILRPVAPDMPAGIAANEETLFRVWVENVSGRACAAITGRGTTPPPSGAV